ncbi:hypothetical protein WN55_00285 [Dufourea novaeangliae]|uniref:Uncharacterized protein n=1 Tax=Dufourea novaeangliae TaxID=178035 RepID=A0A154PAK7_DUFNO|nr:hypothetical protein WN55_00285 [Dufourea novaeangliae]
MMEEGAEGRGEGMEEWEQLLWNRHFETTMVGNRGLLISSDVTLIFERDETGWEQVEGWGGDVNRSTGERTGGDHIGL